MENPWESVSTLKAIYEKVDTDGSGYLDMDEMNQLLALIAEIRPDGPWGKINSKLIWFLLKKDPSEDLTFANFMLFAGKIQSYENDSTKLYKEVFNLMDTNQSGDIDMNELQEFARLVYGEVSKQDLESITKQFGLLSENGTLNQQNAIEFIHVLTEA